MEHTEIREVIMFGVFVPGTDRPLGLSETRQQAEEMAAAYAKYLGEARAALKLTSMKG